MGNKDYKLSIYSRGARPRSPRLRELGGTISVGTSNSAGADSGVLATLSALSKILDWFEEDSNGNIKTKPMADGTERGFYSVAFITAGRPVGSNPDSGGSGTGGISSLTVNLGDISYQGVGTTDVVVNLPAYPTSLPASDVYPWAKQPNKPSYTAAEVGALTQEAADNRYLQISGEVNIAAGTLRLFPGNSTHIAQDDAVPANGRFQLFDVNTNCTAGGNDGYLLAFRWPSGNYVTQIYADVDTTGTMAIRHRNNQSVWSDWYTIWNAANDGSGSGLDADLLDGQQGDWYRKNVLNFCDVTENTSADLNTVLSNGGMAYNYMSATPVLWQNAPSGMSYGRVLQIGTGSLSIQLAWDIYHDSSTPSRSLWYRSRSSTGWGTDWKKVAVQSSANDFIVHGNEFNFVPAGFNNGVWFNYRAVDGSSVTISGYSFGNGAKGLADISAANANISSYLTLASDIRLASGNGLSVLTTTNAAASINTKSIYVSSSYDGAANEGCISLLHSLDLNRQKSSTSGISFYAPSYNSWIMYMAPPGRGQGPKGNIVVPTGNVVTSWGLRQAIEQASGYGWSWEILSATGTAPMPIMELSAESGELNIRNSLTVGYRYIGDTWRISTYGLISNEWLRTVGSCGWYSQTYAGGIYMTDGTWVRVYNNKGFWVSNDIYTTTKVIAVQGYQVGTYPDMGWYYYSDAGRIAAGLSTARGVNVGSLLVSNAWADYTKVPANGIYCKGNIVASGQVASGTASDRRLKRNIRTINNKDTLHILSSLNPVIFEWNDKALTLGGLQGTASSFIAGEYLELLPYAGRKVWDMYDAIYIEQTIPYLVGGWQMHERLLSDHNKRILDLERENKILREEIRKMKRAYGA